MRVSRQVYVIRGEVSARNGCFDVYVAVRDLTLRFPWDYRFTSFPPGQTRSLKRLRKFLTVILSLSDARNMISLKVDINFASQITAVCNAKYLIIIIYSEISDLIMGKCAMFRCVLRVTTTIAPITKEK